LSNDEAAAMMGGVELVRKGWHENGRERWWEAGFERSEIVRTTSRSDEGSKR
jgi:hypothetical protein